jgi:hypothetical protein
MAPIGRPDSVLDLDTHKELVAPLATRGAGPMAVPPGSTTAGLHQLHFGDLSASDRRGIAGTRPAGSLNAVIDRIEVAPHPKGVQTHPVSADLIASRLDIRWLA